MTSIVNQLNFKAAALKNQEDIFNKLTNEQKEKIKDNYRPHKFIIILLLILQKEMNHLIQKIVMH